MIGTKTLENIAFPQYRKFMTWVVEFLDDIKKTQQAPRREIELALKRAQEVT